MYLVIHYFGSHKFPSAVSVNPNNLTSLQQRSCAKGFVMKVAIRFLVLCVVLATGFGCAGTMYHEQGQLPNGGTLIVRVNGKTVGAVRLANPTVAFQTYVEIPRLPLTTGSVSLVVTSPDGHPVQIDGLVLSRA